MTPWLDDGDVRLYHGDALTQLAGMPSESVHCIVTSPPFWGLRDYGTGSWEGGDADCDHTPPKKPERKFTNGRGEGTGDEYAGSNLRSWTTRDGTPFGNTCGKCGAKRVDQQIGLEETPDEWCQRLVAVMREARRVLRADGVCWLECGDTYNANQGAGFDSHQNDGATSHRKTSGLATKRLTPAGIKPKDLVGAPWLLAFALRADGWYLRSDTIWARPNPMPESVTDRPTKAHSYVFLLTKSARYFYDADAIREENAPAYQQPRGKMIRDVNTKTDASRKDGVVGGINGAGSDGARFAGMGRNARSVWSIATEPTPFAHFATFPQALVERCIKAGCPEHGVVLDPFVGSGTTCLVARRLGRHAIGIELNAEYLAISARRLEQPTLWSQPTETAPPPFAEQMTMYNDEVTMP